MPQVEWAVASNLKSSELYGGSPLFHARVTGLIGVVMPASGSFAGSVGSRLIVRGDVVATSNNIMASESLFRLGIVSSLIMMIAFMLYALLLYRKSDRYRPTRRCTGCPRFAQVPSFASLTRRR